MARYRIGFDMTILWAINDRDGSVFPLEDKEVHLYYTCERGRFEADIEIQNSNIVVWHFYGKDQRALGTYTLTVEVFQSNGKRTIRKDICAAFALVGRDCEECYDNGDAHVNEGGTLTLATKLDIYRMQPVIPYIVEDEKGIGYWWVDGVNTGMKASGKSAYEIAVEVGGFEGAEEEFGGYLAQTVDAIAEIEGVKNSKFGYYRIKNNKEQYFASLTSAELYDSNPITYSLLLLQENDLLLPMVSVTYAELVELRDNGKLVAGRQYRITDYVTTTMQENTRTAGYKFDIVVTADDEKTLSEIARAMVSEGDTYFARANLAAWQIWYSLDNDKERFAWADIQDGKGVIYRMIDEWNNDLPYDFKNIMFKRGIYAGGAGIAIEGEEDHFVYCYTFSWEDEKQVIMDASIVGNNGYLLNDEGRISGVHNNTVKRLISYTEEHITTRISQQLLNDIVFLSTYSYGDGTFYGCYNNSFDGNCWRNSFGNSCFNNSFGGDCRSNHLGNDCYDNSFGNNCGSISFGNNCHANSFGNNCDSISFKDLDGLIDNLMYNRIDDGGVSIEVYINSNKGDYGDLKNYHICRGCHHVNINFHQNREHETIYTKTSDGQLKEIVLADLLP